MDGRASEPAPDRAAQRYSEKIILRAVCSESMSPSERSALLARLSGYAWVEMEHRVVFEAIVRCGEMDAAAMRAELQGMTTRLGFPDLDLSEYLHDHNAQNVTPEQSQRGLETLLGKGGTDEE